MAEKVIIFDKNYKSTDLRSSINPKQDKYKVSQTKVNIIKLLKANDKEKNLKLSQRKRDTYRGTQIRMNAKISPCF